MTDIVFAWCSDALLRPASGLFVVSFIRYTHRLLHQVHTHASRLSLIHARNPYTHTLYLKPPSFVPLTHPSSRSIHTPPLPQAPNLLCAPIHASSCDTHTRTCCAPLSKEKQPRSPHTASHLSCSSHAFVLKIHTHTLFTLSPHPSCSPMPASSCTHVLCTTLDSSPSPVLHPLPPRTSHAPPSSHSHACMHHSHPPHASLTHLLARVRR